eukprot:14118431-Alexandrium_andersonii.AAC.1
MLTSAGNCRPPRAVHPNRQHGYKTQASTGRHLGSTARPAATARRRTIHPAAAQPRTLEAHAGTHLHLSQPLRIWEGPGLQQRGSFARSKWIKQASTA